MQVIPAVVPRTRADVESARRRYAPLTASLHVDITDGLFTPNKTWTLAEGEHLPEAHVTEYEAHLMMANPHAAGIVFSRGGAYRIIAHVESFASVEEARIAFSAWRAAGAREIGCAILYATPLERLHAYLAFSDCVQVMTIASIGEQGYPLESNAIARVREIRRLYPTLTISVDGGVTPHTISDLHAAGANWCVVGSFLADADDLETAYEVLTS